VFPIIGGRKVEHLKQNIQALNVSLSPEQIHRIDHAKPFDFGFPYIVIVRTSYESLLCASLKYVNRGIAQQLHHLVNI
jgi:hypothetical protein